MSRKDFQSVPLELAVRFRERLRASRLVALGDSEGYGDLLIAIEDVGRFVNDRPGEHGLGKYSSALEWLAGWTTIPYPSFALLLDALREARNDAAHLGAAARRTTQQATEIATILEDAMANHAKLKRVEQYMMQHPTTAEPWETVSMVRQTLLRTQFSTLPFRTQGGWKLLGDEAVVQFLAGGAKERLTLTIESAVAAGLEVKKANIVRLSDSVDSLRSGRLPLPALVLDDSENLRGIITAFDLL